MQDARSLLRLFIVFLPVTLALAFVTASPAALATTPAISSLNPSSILVGSPGFVLTVNGTNFVPGATVKWGSTSLATGYTSASVLTATVPSSLLKTAGQQNITVVTTAGTSSVVLFAVNPFSLLLSSAPLPAGTVNVTYSATISASGTVIQAGGYNYAWTVNGSNVPTNGTSLTLPGGLSLVSTGSSSLSIGGKPTVAGTVSLNVTATACRVSPTGCQLTTMTSGAVMYSITVNSAVLHTVNGGIHTLNCGQPLKGVTVSINTNPVKTATTNLDGTYSISSIPNGTYTVTPSIIGPTSLFYPVNQTAAVNGNDLNVNFQAVLGFTISGTVSYSGSKTGRIYVELVNNNCGVDINPGTSIPAAGAFTIRGVAPGSYTLYAYMDNLGYGAQNASNPAGSKQSVNLSNASLAGVSVALADPLPVTLSSPPSIAGVSPFSQGVFIPYQSTTNNKGVETPTSYTVQWSTNATFTAPAGSASFRATGKGHVWVLNTSNLPALSGGHAYYFRVQGVAGSSTSSWTAPIGPVTIAAPTTGNSVSGTVTFAGTATGPLYVGLYDQSTNKMYGTQVGSKTTPPTSPAAYSIKVPSGSNYFLFGIIDQNNNGLIDPGDIQNTNGDGAGAVVISGNAAKNLTLPNANSTLSLTTQHQRQPNEGGGTHDNYGLYFQVNPQNKLPVAVTLASGPHVLSPLDVGICMDCGGGGGFGFWVNTDANVPVAADSYGLQITYSNGTSETLTAKVGPVLNAFASSLLPNSSGASATPRFTWTDPVGMTGYRYSFSLWDSNGNVIWQVPGDNSKSNGFDTSVTSLNWGVDPTDSSNKPNLTSLAPGGSYQWQIQAQDGNYNQSSMQANFTVAGGKVGLSLPSKPSSLPSAAIVGQSYNGAINVSGGPSGAGYNWTVNGIQIPINNTSKLIADGLSANNSGGNTLLITGTPTAAQTVTLNVAVADNKGDPSASATYTISVSNAPPLTLPSSGTASALINYAFSESVDASGGVSPYTWTVNGHQMGTSGGQVALSNNLVASSNGGSTLAIGGKPTALGTSSISVSVVDHRGGSAGPFQYSVAVNSPPNGAHNSYLSGRYSCLTQGFNDNDGSRWASLARIQLNGTGGLTGIFDANGRSFTSGAISGTITGTYAIAADNNGLVSMTSMPGKLTKWALALTSAVAPAQQFRMVEIDDVGTSPSGQHGTSNCYLDTSSAFAATTLSGSSFAMGMTGESNSGNARALVGRFSASSGNVTSGIIDLAKGGNAAVESDPFTGTYGTPNATTGRVPVTLNSGGTALSMVIYIIDADRSFILDTVANDGLLAGNVRRQRQAAYSGANISGPFVLYMQGVEYENGNGGSPMGSYSELMRGTGDGSGHMTINASYMDNSGQYSVGSANGTPGALVFSSTYPGRVTIPAGNNSTVYLYLFNTNNAFEMSVNGSGNVDSGWVEPQTTTTYTDAAIAGSYMMGNMPPLFVGTNSNVGELKLDSVGNITGNVTNAGEGTFSFDQPLSANYNWDPLNPFAFLVGNGQSSCILINSTKAACTPRIVSSPSVIVLQR